MLGCQNNAPVTDPTLSAEDLVSKWVLNRGVTTLKDPREVYGI